MLLVHNLTSFTIAYSIMSFIEYGTHRWMLHMNTIAQMFPRRKFIRVHFHDHAVSHHSTFYKCFKREDDPEGQHVGMLIPFGFYKYILLLVVMIGFVDPLSALYLTGAVIAHFFVWNAFHEIMHRPARPWYAGIVPVCWWLDYVEYYHFLHHQHRNKNYNAFLPLWDLLLGTLAAETALDRKVWTLVNNGYFVDRKGEPMLEVQPGLANR